jgi:tetratricopeptide (TPR) repeat protein
MSVTRRARGSRLRWLAALAPALALAFGAAPVRDARADTPPSRWDRARDPDAGKNYKLHVAVQRRLAQDDLEARFTGALESNKARAREMLERARADKSPDVRLRFDLGRVYLELGASEGPQNYRKAATVLREALAIAPDHPGAEMGWLNLAFACGHLGDHECEKKSYIQVLRLQTEEIRRATPSLNLAETEMHLGNLREAIDGYRETIRLAGRVPTHETAPLAVWGLAVALDRSGDRVAAEKEARFALELERSMNMVDPSGRMISFLLRSSNVFFVPAYELHWYEGLGASAQAKAKAGDRGEAVRLWRAAEASFAAYVRLAQPDDRWLELAKLRHATAKVEREAAERRDRSRPKPKAPQPEDPEDIPL